MKDINICLDCENEWEENHALYCPRCGSGDFYIADEEKK